MSFAKVSFQVLKLIQSVFRFNPIHEAEDHPTTEDIWKFLFSKVTESFPSIKQAFLVFDDVRIIVYNYSI